MPKEQYAPTPTSVATPAPERRHAERLSLRAAIFWIGVLSLCGWAMIIAVALALV
jgi:hypothetical protein